MAKAAGVALESAEKEAGPFVRAILGGPGGVLWGIAGDWARELRHKNLISIFLRAKRRLEDAGVSPHAVPLKIIHPFLEAASLEEEPELQELWANLIANGADPRNVNSLRVVYIEMLRTLSACQAKFLDEVFALRRQEDGGILHEAHGWTFVIGELEEPAFRAGVITRTQLTGLTYGEYAENEKEISDCFRQLDMALTNFQRNGIMEPITGVEDIVLSRELSDVPLNGTVGQVMSSLMRVRFRPKASVRYRLTALGRAFIVACKPPQK